MKDPRIQDFVSLQVKKEAPKRNRKQRTNFYQSLANKLKNIKK